jgi:hypothetical protein
LGIGNITGGNEVTVVNNNGDYVINVDPSCCDGGASGIPPGTVVYVQPNGTFGGLSMPAGTVLIGTNTSTAPVAKNLTAGLCMIITDTSGSIIIGLNETCSQTGECSCAGLVPGGAVYVLPNGSLTSTALLPPGSFLAGGNASGTTPVITSIVGAPNETVVYPDGNGHITVSLDPTVVVVPGLLIVPGLGAHGIVITGPGGVLVPIILPPGGFLVGNGPNTAPSVGYINAGSCIVVTETGSNYTIALNNTCAGSGPGGCDCAGLTPGGAVYVLPNGTLTSTAQLPPGSFLAGSNNSNGSPVITTITGTPNETSVTSNGAGTINIKLDPTLVVIPAALAIPIIGPHGFLTLGPGGIIVPLILPVGGVPIEVAGPNGTSTTQGGYINGGKGITVTPVGNNLTISFNGGNLGSPEADSICVGSTPYSVGTASQSTVVVTGSGGASFVSAMQGGTIFWPSSNSSTTPAFIVNVPSSSTLWVHPSQTIPDGPYVICYNGVQSAAADLGVAESLWVRNMVVTGTPTIYSTGNAGQTGTVITGSGFTQAMVGGVIYWPTLNLESFITGYVSSTQLTAGATQIVSPPKAFVLYYGSTQSYGGDLGVQNLVLSGHTAATGNNILTIDGNGLVGELQLGSTPSTMAMVNNANILSAMTVQGLGCAVVTVGSSTFTIDVNASCLTGGGSGGNLTAVFGTLHQVTATPSGNTVTISLPNAVYIGPETAGPLFPNANGLNLFAPAATQGGISFYSSDAYPVTQEIQFGHDEWFKAYGALWTGANWVAADGGSDIFLQSKMNGVLTLQGQPALTQGTVAGFSSNTLSIGYAQGGTWMNTLAIGSTITTAGTISTGGSLSTTVTGSGTSFSAGMVGGILMFTGISTTPYITTIVAVASATSLTVATQVAATPGTSYRILWGGAEFAQAGYAHIDSNLLLGTQQVLGTSVDLAAGLNIFGLANGVTGMNIYLNDLYPAQSLFSYTYGNHFYAMGARYHTGDGQWYSSQTQNPWRLNQNGNNFNIDYGTTVVPNTKNAVVTWHTQFAQTPTSVTINAPTVLSSTLNVGGNTILGGALNINSFTGGKILVSSGTQVVESTTGSLRLPPTTVTLACGSGPNQPASIVVNVYMARAGDLITYQFNPTGGPFTVSLLATQCTFLGTFPIPSTAYEFASSSFVDYCTVGRGIFSFANALHTGCIKSSSLNVMELQVYALTGMSGFIPGSQYQLPQTLSFTFVAPTPFT